MSHAAEDGSLKEKQSKAGEQGEKKARRKEEKVQAPVADVRCSESEHDKF